MDRGSVYIRPPIEERGLCSCSLCISGTNMDLSSACSEWITDRSPAEQADQSHSPPRIKATLRETSPNFLPWWPQYFYLFGPHWIWLSQSLMIKKTLLHLTEHVLFSVSLKKKGKDWEPWHQSSSKTKEKIRELVRHFKSGQVNICCSMFPAVFTETTYSDLKKKSCYTISTTSSNALIMKPPRMRELILHDARH